MDQSSEDLYLVFCWECDHVIELGFEEAQEACVAHTMTSGHMTGMREPASPLPTREERDRMLAHQMALWSS